MHIWINKTKKNYKNRIKKKQKKKFFNLLLPQLFAIICLHNVAISLSLNFFYHLYIIYFASSKQTLCNTSTLYHT